MAGSGSVGSRTFGGGAGVRVGRGGGLHVVFGFAVHASEHTGSNLLPMSTVPAAIEAVAAAIPAGLGHVAAAVEAAVDVVALVVQAGGVAPVAECGLAVGAQIQTVVDAIALAVQTGLD